MISESLKFRITEAITVFTETLSVLKDSSAKIEQLSQKLPVFYDEKVDYETLLLEVCQYKHMANAASRDAFKAKELANAEYELLKAEASLDGVYDHFSKLEIPKAKVTEAMRDSYAMSHKELSDLFKLTAEFKAIAKYLQDETQLLSGTEINFRRLVDSKTNLGGF